MHKQQKAALNMAKFIRSQTLLLLENSTKLDLDEQADQCRKLHEDSEALYQSLIAEFGAEG
ncbi:Rop family plasmid primer RNA-binding protein [Escherichia coli]|nr:Rop family plasmid primer RNA-binding protein [Escherichia coli]